ncbi:PREDICTED: beta-fructofuranosidase, cell wall isozyme-like [Lupinus angustifolius]|uniref:beta-fructofuranosidase, cell wall isozyme-like n=1 Tax=Lupinus angustifolius TaxID=3871 RepID=UPI00092F9870|nr:PREDICTED: beta-fructofuranosidase, cell wall isozyme-like [Lupinus angustifolius]
MILSSIWVLTFFSFIYVNGVLPIEATHHSFRELQNLSSDYYKQPYRTAYHFQPPKNWINDPNGPLRYKGLYHLFYQYNPKGAVWGNIVWAHSVSKDLVNWAPLDPAIFPSQPSDINGCWSGSTTLIHGGKPVILYTGINPLNQQVQNLAYPKNLSDPFLREWVKSPKNPLMAPTSANKINSSSFRDPTTSWLGKDGYWRVLIGSKRNTLGLAILYKSKDFVNWAKAKYPLHSVQGTGMWECPDFFPILNDSPIGIDTSFNGDNIRHVLKVSLDDKKHDYYMIGSYDIVKDKFIPDKAFKDSESFLRYDYGKYYASKTFFDDGKNRRILLGWVNESSSVAHDIKKGWSGIHAIPRAIWLDKSGKQLVQWPVVEIEKLRANPVNWPTKLLKGGHLLQINGVTAAQADVEISFEVNNLGEAEVLDNWTDPQSLCSQKGPTYKSGLGPFGLLVFASKGLQEYTSVYFKIFRYQHKNLVLLCSDQSRSSLDNNNDKTNYGTFVDVDPLHEKLSLRSLIDHSVVESFGGEGKACITARVYPTLAINDEAQLYVFNNGTADVKLTRLSAWSLKKAQINGKIKIDKTGL